MRARRSCALRSSKRRAIARIVPTRVYMVGQDPGCMQAARGAGCPKMAPDSLGSARRASEAPTLFTPREGGISLVLRKPALWIEMWSGGGDYHEGEKRFRPGEGTPIWGRT